jgi:HNH endonuclease
VTAGQTLKPVGYEFKSRGAHNLATPCALWTGAVTSSGYGSLRHEGRTVQAHRKAWEDANGPIPDGLHIDHLCRNRLCINPEHLEPVTPGENTRRARRIVTHCPQGHEYTEANTLRNGNGNRYCRTCHNTARRVAKP